MKPGTPMHPKMRALAQALGLEAWGAVGVLESLWQWTALYAPEGDIGRHTDAVIAAGIGWQRSASELIDALLMTRWLDPDQQCRVVVHDWRDHLHNGVLQPEFDGQILEPTPAVAEPFRLRPDWGSGKGPPRSTHGFEEFWKHYPKPCHKPEALRAWIRVGGAFHLPAILAGIERWQQSDSWREGFLENPATFLRQRQWEDRPSPPRRSREERERERAHERIRELWGQK